MSLLQIENLSFGYPKNNILFSGLNLNAKAGEIIAISGGSGSGKTTFLKICCNVIPNIIGGNLLGKRMINDQDISNKPLPELAPDISVLMQEPENQLFLPTVEQELAFGPENLCIAPSEILARIDSTLKLLNIENLRYANTATLSFGQKKLVALASIITLSPKIILLDEPSTGLSEAYLNVVIDVLKQLAKQGKLIIIADHLPQILAIANQEIRLD